KLGGDALPKTAASTRENDSFPGKRHWQFFLRQQNRHARACRHGALRSKAGRATRIEIAKQIAIQPVEVTRRLDHQRQMPLIYSIDQVLEEFGVVHIEVAMGREIFESAIVGG